MERVRPILELEATEGVLEEERDDAEIGVGPSSLDQAFLKRLDRDGRVVEHAQLAGGRNTRVEQGALGDVQADFTCGHDFEARLLGRCKVVLDELFIAWKVVLGIDVWELLVTGRATVEVLLMTVLGL